MLLNADKEPETQCGLRTNNILICKFNTSQPQLSCADCQISQQCGSVTIFNYIKVQWQCWWEMEKLWRTRHSQAFFFVFLSLTKNSPWEELKDERDKGSARSSTQCRDQAAAAAAAYVDTFVLLRWLSQPQTAETPSSLGMFLWGIRADVQKSFPFGLRATFETLCVKWLPRPCTRKRHKKEGNKYQCWLSVQRQKCSTHKIWAHLTISRECLSVFTNWFHLCLHCSETGDSQCTF